MIILVKNQILRKHQIFYQKIKMFLYLEIISEGVFLTEQGKHKNQNLTYILARVAPA